MNAKNPSGLGIRKALRPEYSLVHQSWRGLAADELEASICLLGEMIATFENMNVALGEAGDNLKVIDSNLKRVKR